MKSVLGTRRRANRPCPRDTRGRGQREVPPSVDVFLQAPGKGRVAGLRQGLERLQASNPGHLAAPGVSPATTRNRFKTARGVWGQRIPTVAVGGHAGTWDP